MESPFIEIAAATQCFRCDLSLCSCIEKRNSPMITNTEDNSLHILMARTILCGRAGKKDQLLRDLNELHPQSMSDMISVDDMYTPDVFQLLTEVAEGGWTASEISLVLQQVRFNCFGSGLYKIASMVNHHCRPNSAKFSKVDSHTNQTITEFVATRNIVEGEEITISYTGIIEYSHAYRSDLFYKQHFVKLGLSPWPIEMEELVTLPGISVLSADKSRRDLEVKLDREFGLELLCSLKKTTIIKGHFLLNSLQAFRNKAGFLFGSRHLIFLRIDRASVVVYLLIMNQECGYTEGSIDAALALIGVGLRLLPILEMYFGDLHCEFATLLQDLHIGIEYLLGSHLSSKLYTCWPDQLGTFSKATRFSHSLKTRSKKIQALYAS